MSSFRRNLAPFFLSAQTQKPSCFPQRPRGRCSKPKPKHRQFPDLRRGLCNEKRIKILFRGLQLARSPAFHAPACRARRFFRHFRPAKWGLWHHARRGRGRRGLRRPVACNNQVGGGQTAWARHDNNAEGDNSGSNKSDICWSSLRISGLWAPHRECGPHPAECVQQQPTGIVRYPCGPSVPRRCSLLSSGHHDRPSTVDLGSDTLMRALVFCPRTLAN